MTTTVHHMNNGVPCGATPPMTEVSDMLDEVTCDECRAQA